MGTTNPLSRQANPWAGGGDYRNVPCTGRDSVASLDVVSNRRNADVIKGGAQAKPHYDEFDELDAAEQLGESNSSIPQQQSRNRISSSQSSTSALYANSMRLMGSDEYDLSPAPPSNILKGESNGTAHDHRTSTEQDGERLIRSRRKRARPSLKHRLPLPSSSRMGYPVEWNQQFQFLLECPEATEKVR